MTQGIFHRRKNNDRRDTRSMIMCPLKAKLLLIYVSSWDLWNALWIFAKTWKNGHELENSTRATWLSRLTIHSLLVVQTKSMFNCIAHFHKDIKWYEVISVIKAKYKDTQISVQTLKLSKDVVSVFIMEVFI